MGRDLRCRSSARARGWGPTAQHSTLTQHSAHVRHQIEDLAKSLCNMQTTALPAALVRDQLVLQGDHLLGGKAPSRPALNPAAREGGGTTTNQVFTLQQQITDKSRRPAAACFVDSSKAFDLVNREEALWADACRAQASVGAC